MSAALIELALAQTSGRPSQQLTILLVGAVGDQAGSESPIFGQFQWPTERARGCAEALPLIRRDQHRVIVSEKDLPDGNWKDVLEVASAREHPPLVIVTSRLADEYLWAEVLNLGGYDVLAQPFDREEVRRTVSLAWQHWQSRYEIAMDFRRKRRSERERSCRETRETGRAY